MIDRSDHLSKLLAGEVNGEVQARGSDEKALKALRDLGATGATFTDWCKASGLPKATFKNARGRLLGNGLVQQEGTQYRVTDGAEGQGQGQGQPGS